MYGQICLSKKLHGEIASFGIGSIIGEDFLYKKDQNDERYQYLYFNSF
jgi:hypothetical protein